MTPREAPAYDRYDAEIGRLICLWWWSSLAGMCGRGGFGKKDRDAIRGGWKLRKVEDRATRLEIGDHRLMVGF